VGPDDATEDLDAEPASGVVLSDLLDSRKPGTAFEYEYDFGDGWTHHVELVGDAELAAGELICVDGANRGPVEDSGGPGGYTRLLQIVADPEHPEHQDARFWVYDATGEYGKYFDPAGFDRQAANRKLRLLSLQWWPQPLTDEERDAVLRPVRWMLENAAPDGLELTKHLIDWKLLRKFKGRLVLTPRQTLPGTGHPIRDEWVSNINQVVRRNLKCLHLMEPKADHRGRALLTDGGVKFLLAVRAMRRSV
jgi:hypothetical protein